ncbi:ImmA/IrrE family metallo-endopeptidase [Brevibacillus nitrificans]|uniref:ImmA/IrrE family metallo-endopeptidase n=1 Tax=Brevibacillus nitrificans TaxID=651560 RepID=UPI0028599C20|nr:ImmA/IrrE family metallo-endopeptidase [Brevibacillus nitrificans]MDR7316615.1 Zn-dependent peptidase ImmA (M78 family) [Brevibacillus nitrificans]
MRGASASSPERVKSGMLHLYERTHLEEWVEGFYKQIGITSLSDLTIENVSARLRIGVTFAPGVADEVIFDADYAHIFINSLHCPKRRWEVFCHELCHPLRHLGNQLVLPDEFRKWQERDAQAFQFYAAVPFFLLQTLELPDHEKELIDLLSVEFGVTHGFAKRRWEQVLRRIARGRLHHELVRTLSVPKKKAAPRLLREQLVSYMAAKEKVRPKADFILRYDSLIYNANERRAASSVASMIQKAALLRLYKKIKMR